MAIEPIISVIIPTRDRPDTLAACLKSMAHQNSPAIEIVVHDNASGPNTHAAVQLAQSRDPRIRYVRSNARVSQRQNFEMGLAAARGQYLSIIGDDDGFAAGSLDWLADVLDRYPVDGVRWNLISYVWPTLSTDGEGFLEVRTKHWFGGAEWLPGARLAGLVINAETEGSWDNILVYHGMISRGVYEHMKAKGGGTFFGYPLPDVYAHNTIPFSCRAYLRVHDIVSIYGVSGHSSGASWSQSSHTGSTSPGEKWITESMTDEIAEDVSWQPEARVMRFHDYSALKVAEAKGLLSGRSPNLDIWLRAAKEEMHKTPWTIASLAALQPKAPHDGAFIQAAREIENLGLAEATKPNSQYTAGTQPTRKGYSARIKNVNETLNDDIEGAVLAIAELRGGNCNSYSFMIQRSDLQLRTKTQLGQRSKNALNKIADKLCATRRIPRSLWSRLRDIEKPEWVKRSSLKNALHAGLRDAYQRRNPSGRERS